MDKSQISETSALFALLMETLTDYCSRQEVHIRPGASIQQIDGVESQYQIHLPYEFPPGGVFEWEVING